MLIAKKIVDKVCRLLSVDIEKNEKTSYTISIIFLLDDSIGSSRKDFR